MSFDTRETSLADGQPVRLYQFSRGVLRWLYNSSDRDISYQNQPFKAVSGGIADNGIRQTGQASADAFVITAPADLEVALLFRGMPPSAEIGLRVFDLHYGEPEAICRFVGTISSVRWTTLDSCTISCDDIENSMQRPGLTDTFSLSCTTTLYSKRCKVDRNLFRVDATVQSLDGAAISSGAFAGQPAGWFVNGFVEWAIGGGEYEVRHIEAHSGEILKLLGGTAGLIVGQAIRAYAGCDFLIATCHGRFGNKDNFQGQPHLDGKSPFDGDQVF